MFINKKCLWLICFRCFWYAILWCGKFPPIIRYSPGCDQRLIEKLELVFRCNSCLQLWCELCYPQHLKKISPRIVRFGGFL